MDYKTKIDKRDVLLIISALAERLNSPSGYAFHDEVSDRYPDDATMTITEQNI